MERLVFQALDWQEKSTEADVSDNDGDSDSDGDGDGKRLPQKRLLVVVYGRRVDGGVVRVTLENFKPSLLLKMSKKKAQAAVNISGINVADVEFGTTRLKDFVGFDFEDKVYTVLRFNNPLEFAGARRKLKDLGLGLYNCRVQPFMQLIHRAGVSPGGWMSVPAPRQIDAAKLIDVACDWKSLSHVHDPPAPMAPFVVTAFDIECYSKSGDFPAAKKGYNRFARDIIKFIEDNDADPDLMNRLEHAVLAAFDGREQDGIAELELMHGHNKPTLKTLRQSLLSDLGESIVNTKWRTTSSTVRVTNLAAKLDCLTERGQRDALRTAAEACATAVSRAIMYSCCPDVCQEKGFAAGKEAAPFASPPIIAEIAKASLKGGTSAYNSSKHASDLDEQVANRALRWAATAADSAVMPWAKQPLPLLKGDPVIQVGLTTRRGQDGGLEKTILVLGGCDDIPGTNVVRYDDEVSLLIGMAQTFKDIDPDFITGYNIMGFDYQYIYHRAQELGVLGFMEMGRFAETDDMLERNRYTPLFLEKRMVSAAYGDNTMRYFDMPGRVQFDLMKVVQREHSLPSYKLDAVARHFTGDCKDGLTPADIFRMHMGTDSDRAAVAAYCVQDCALCSDLVNKLNTLPNAIGMADVCLVPVSWIFLKGQGCKILSLVSKQCRVDGFAMPELRNPQAEGYDGAHVLPPRIGVYIENPVAVLDFSSLYPSSMISANLSHDTMLMDDQDDPEGCTVEPVTFNLYPRNGPSKEVVRRFVQPGGRGREGVLPRILKTLLSQRAAVRKRIPGETDAFARSVLDGLQAAFKVTANSLYGQLGSATSDICCVDIAASTTAVGRSMLLKLRDYVQTQAHGDVIYGDTDSCFMTFPQACVGLTGLDAVAATIAAGKKCSSEFRKFLPPPQDAEYEKTFWPMILISKKRYVGNMFEHDAFAKPKQKSMGLVLKRRDNAPVVKRVYGESINMILNKGDVAEAAAFVKDAMIDLIHGRVDISELIVSKNLRTGYANPDQIAHAVLAKRMAERDPGSAPAVGDRVPYVYVRPIKGEFPQGTLQGNRIEHPDHIDASALCIDYSHYVTNQVMKPVSQLFALMVERIPGCRLTTDRLEVEYTMALNASCGDADKARKKVDVLKQAEVVRLMFQDSLDIATRKKNGMVDITAFF